jgi:hypothetical protein
MIAQGSPPALTPSGDLAGEVESRSRLRVCPDGDCWSGAEHRRFESTTDTVSRARRGYGGRGQG